MSERLEMLERRARPTNAPQIEDSHEGRADESATAGAESPSCPICLVPFKEDDICATDIDLDTCHAACLEGSPVVNLHTGEPAEGDLTTYRYGDTDA